MNIDFHRSNRDLRSHDQIQIISPLIEFFFVTLSNNTSYSRITMSFTGNSRDTLDTLISDINVTEEIVESVLLIYLPLISTLWFCFNGVFIVESGIIQCIVLLLLVVWSIVGVWWFHCVRGNREQRRNDGREMLQSPDNEK